MNILSKKKKAFLRLQIWDTIYKFLTFHDFFIATNPWMQKLEIKRVRKKQKKTCLKLKDKGSITVAFFLQNESIWKYDALYWLLEESDIFHPVVVITPFNLHLYYDKTECVSVMEQASKFVKSKHYRYICAYDFQKKDWLDIKKIVNPDIVFFTKPYKDTLPAYHLYNFKNKLTLNAPYGICCIDIYRLNYNLPFHNLLWKFLVETDYQKEFSEQHSLCKGDNAVVVGALATEKLIDPLLAGSVPIYYGNNLVERDFNKNAFKTSESFFNKAYSEIEAIQKKYDEETDHGTNHEKQDEYNKEYQ